MVTIVMLAYLCYQHHSLSSDKRGIIDFINTCGNTGGGDSAESYELVLHEARDFNWTAGANKIVVLIGDDVPHGANERQNTSTLIGETN
jgi:hypothetical protein